MPPGSECSGRAEPKIASSMVTSKDWAQAPVSSKALSDRTCWYFGRPFNESIRVYRPLTVQPTQPAPETQISSAACACCGFGLHLRQRCRVWESGTLTHRVTSQSPDVYPEPTSRIPSSPFRPASTARQSRRAGARRCPRSSLPAMKSSESSLWESPRQWQRMWLI